MEHVWQALLKTAKLKYRKPYSMRHSFATWAVEGSEEKRIAPASLVFHAGRGLPHRPLLSLDACAPRSLSSTTGGPGIHPDPPVHAHDMTTRRASA